MISARVLAVLAFGSLLGAAVLVACSNDEVNPNPGSSSGTSSSGSSGTSSGSSGTSSGSSGTSGSGGEDAGHTVNGCRSFEDRSGTDAKRVIPWDFVIFNAPERCMKVKVGQKVVWGSSDGGVRDTFTDHPVVPKNGDTPNPIGGITPAGEVTFGTAGTFGYQCEIHGSTMAGAVLVTP